MLDICLPNLIENLPQYNTTNAISVDVLRLDKIDQQISGNKWFKLQYYVEEAMTNNAKSIITYGGIWSNHIAATAAVCKQVNMPCTLMVRSDEALPTPTLALAKANGATILYTSRKNYTIAKNTNGIDSNSNYHIPEGGAGNLGIQGAAAILDFATAVTYTHILLSIGTGTTFAGIVTAAKSCQQIIGISAVKPTQLYDDVVQLTKQHNVSIINDYHFGGFVKYNTALIDFMNTFYTLYHIPTDVAYTGKLFYAVTDLVNKNYFGSNSKVLVIHSGGLQGNVSLTNNALIF